MKDLPDANVLYTRHVYEKVEEKRCRTALFLNKIGKYKMHVFRPYTIIEYLKMSWSNSNAKNANKLIFTGL